MMALRHIGGIGSWRVKGLFNQIFNLKRCCQAVEEDPEEALQRAGFHPSNSAHSRQSADFADSFLPTIRGVGSGHEFGH
jgi:hypothetical protein